MARRSTRSDEHQRPVNRRLGLIPGRRFGLTLACALAALGLLPAVAVADPSSDQVVSATVYSPSGTTQNDSVSLAQLQSNPRCTPYSGTDVNELGRTGFVDVQLAPAGTWALSTVLGCLSTPVPVAAVHGVTVINGQGDPEEDSGSTLTPADLAPQGSTDFNNPQEAPVVQALGSLNQYDRPWRGNGQGQTDYDFLDEVQGSDNGQPLPIAIEVFEGPLLTVTVSASQTTVPVGEAVTFTANVTGQNGSPLSYSWNFAGGAPSSTAASPQVTFGNTGQYDVTVQVSDSAGGGGGAEIPITVGTPPSAATGSHPQTGSGKSRKSHTPSGPQKSKGNHAGGAAGKSTTGNSTTAGKGSGTSTANTTSTTSSTTSTSTTPTGSPNHQTGAPTPHSTAAPKPAAPHTITHITRATPSPRSGALVSGLLVSDVRPLSPNASPLVRVVPAVVATAPPARQAVRASLLPAFGAGFAVLLLLGLGAGRELRGRRRGPTPRVGS
ncbi:MAG TPA: PKD domain-containing protein [Solirubrobacteraceae bacterium]|nr:PKD domain-containing protein [Solirubrobacteraceae bacterium]